MPSHPTRYIEIDSDFRNRSLYPCPAEFSIPVYCSSRSKAEEALACSDPFRASYPYQAWTLPPTTTFNINGWGLKAVWPIRVGERADAYSRRDRRGSPAALGSPRHSSVTAGAS